MSKYQILFLVTLLVCSVAHSNFTLNFAPPTDAISHLWQWLPLLLGAICFMGYGWELYRQLEQYSLFGFLGVCSLPFLIVVIGYVVGYHFIFKILWII